MFKVLPALLVMVILAAVSSFAQTAAKPDTNIKVIAVIPAKKSPVDSPAAVAPAKQIIAVVAPAVKEKANLEKILIKEKPSNVEKALDSVLAKFKVRLLKELPKTGVSDLKRFQVYCTIREQVTYLDTNSGKFNVTDSAFASAVRGKMTMIYCNGWEGIKDTVFTSATKYLPPQKTAAIKTK
jgi:hypothetical protein